jgi:hypothetical protein
MLSSSSSSLLDLVYDIRGVDNRSTHLKFSFLKLILIVFKFCSTLFFTNVVTHFFIIFVFTSNYDIYILILSTILI